MCKGITLTKSISLVQPWERCIVESPLGHTAPPRRGVEGHPSVEVSKNHKPANPPFRPHFQPKLGETKQSRHLGKRGQRSTTSGRESVSPPTPEIFPACPDPCNVKGGRNSTLLKARQAEIRPHLAPDKRKIEDIQSACADTYPDVHASKMAPAKKEKYSEAGDPTSALNNFRKYTTKAEQ